MLLSNIVFTGTVVNSLQNMWWWHSVWFCHLTFVFVHFFSSLYSTSLSLSLCGSEWNKTVNPLFYCMLFVMFLIWHFAKYVSILTSTLLSLLSSGSPSASSPPPLPPLCLSFSLSTLRSLIAHEDSVTCVRFQPETHYFFSSGKDGVLKYWDADRFVLGGTVMHVTLCRYLLLTAHHAVKTKDDDRYPAFSRLSPPLSFSFFSFFMLLTHIDGRALSLPWRDAQRIILLWNSKHKNHHTGNNNGSD